LSENIIIELSNVYLKSDRGADLFRDLNFKLESGRSAVIQGPPGSGKTSLIDLMLGRRFADKGAVELFGNLIRKRRARQTNRIRRKIGGVGGPFELMPSLSVAENIVFPLVLAGERKRIQRERLLKMLSEFSLLKQAGERPDKLTRVEKTLAQFARASIANQPLLIIDEPSAGLDSKTFARISEYLVNVSLSGRSMIILTSEALEEKLPNCSYHRIQAGAIK
jgi:putative ABC transport system ATP-binding protein